MSQVFQYVTEKIIEAVERDGLLPWQKPWKCSSACAKSYAGQQYRGVNALLTVLSGRPGPWITYNQARAQGGTVKKGEKGTMITFYKVTEYPNKKDASKTDKVPLFRYFTVFSLEQTEGVKDPSWLAKEKAQVSPEGAPLPLTPIQSAESIWGSYSDKPEVTDGGQGAWYCPATDKIGMPARDTFKTPEGFYTTLFHEGVHSTGAASRTGRTIGETKRFGSADYSREELVAEIGAAFLCAEAGIANERTIENSAAYVKNWLERLKADNRLIVQAASAAQKAVDHILKDRASPQDETEGQD